MPDKHKNFSEWYTEILTRAQLIDIRYGVKGAIVYLPNAMDIVDRIFQMFEEELRKTGHRKVLFPVFIPEENLKKESEHFRGFEGEVFWITKAGYRDLDKKLALRPTSETAMYPMFNLWIKSHKDLPLKVFQSVSVYRYETKATRPLLRGREFLWIEAHDAFKNEEEARKQVEQDMEIFKKVVLEKLGIPFVHLKREEFDKFAGAVDTYAFEAVLPDGRMLQIGTTHYLGTNFSRVFSIEYLDIDESHKLVHQTCFGIGISRILAALISIHGDEFGLVLPFSIAPIKIVIIPIPKKDADVEQIKKICLTLTDKLKAKGYRVEADLSDKTPGEKFYKYDMLGVPIRIEVGPREVKTGKITIFRRDKRKRISIPINELERKIRELEKEILNNLRSKAEEEFKNRFREVSNKQQLIELARKGNFIIKAGFCGREECAEQIKAETGYEVRGMNIKEKPKKTTCIWCGRATTKTVYIAKAY